MKTRFYAATALATLWTIGAASAADLPRPMYTKAPLMPAPMMYNWTGFYIGANVGGSWGRQDASLATPTGVSTASPDLNGVIGGGQFGYNWQGMGSPWVLGLEADIQGAGQRGSGAFATPAGLPGGVPPVPGAAISFEDKLEWFGTVRGRVGYALGDGRWLPYVTGGLAYGGGNINGTGTIGTGPGVATAVAFSNDSTYVGWTIGAGLEYAFADKWSAKLEYLYMDLGNGPTVSLSPSNTISTGRMTDNIGRVGVNYHF